MGNYQACVYSECDSIPEIKANVYGLHKGKRKYGILKHHTTPNYRVSKRKVYHVKSLYGFKIMYIEGGFLFLQVLSFLRGKDMLQTH